MKDKDVEARFLRWKLKQANKSIGRQGETIHRLRAELAEVRALNSRLERGELRHLDAIVAGLNSALAYAEAEIARLNEKLENSVDISGIKDNLMEAQ